MSKASLAKRLHDFFDVEAREQMIERFARERHIDILRRRHLVLAAHISNLGSRSR